MDELFDNLSTYSELIGKGQISPGLVTWVLITTLIMLVFKSAIWTLSERAKIKKLPSSLLIDIFACSCMEYIISIIVALIMISLFKSDENAWNFILAPLLGIVSSIAVTIFLVSKKTSLLKDSYILNGKQRSGSSTENVDSHSSTSAQSLSDVKDSVLNSSNQELTDRVEVLSKGLVTAVDKINSIADTINTYSEAFDRVESKLADIQDAVETSRDQAAEENAIQCRVRILRFNLDLMIAKRTGEKLPKDLFDQTLIDIDIYDAYCTSHPGFKNSIAESAEHHILKVYEAAMNNDGFLQY